MPRRQGPGIDAVEAVDSLGSVLAFAPREKFRLVSGEDHLTEYLFNRRVIRHQFCRTCGIESFAWGEMPDGTPMVAVNAGSASSCR